MNGTVDIEQTLDAFRLKARVASKGQLALVLQITDQARKRGLPLNAAELVTPNQGQVAGLSKGATQAILKRHGIERVLAEEGGRTSRGGMGLMQAYVQVLNTLPNVDPEGLERVEIFWVARVRVYFSSKPFKVRYDRSLCIRAVVADVIAQALKRQQENPGTMYAGTVLQHLVGAKLETMWPGRVAHFGASVADMQIERGGDFALEDSIIHVTTSPGEAVIRKCQGNLDARKRPLIVTLPDGVIVAKALAKNAGIENRIEILDAEQFLATNVHEWSEFGAHDPMDSLQKLVTAYNIIVASYETDPSLMLEIA
ncbi:MAG: DUF4928 family protein [Armatimonadota bacterium]